MIPPAMTVRAEVPERMDDPGCDERDLLRTVRQFASINRLVARYRSILRRTVLRDMALDRNREYHLVDLGAGGCDIAVWLLRTARRRGLRLRVTACDADPRIVAYAREAAGAEPGLVLREMDVVEDVVEEPVDYVFASHFLHHLTDAQVVALLRRWGPRVRRRMVFSDLLRSRLSYVGFAVLSAAYRNSFARDDGLLSIRKGFRPGELRTLAARAGLGDRAEVARMAPGRVVLYVDGLAVPTFRP